MGRRALGRLLCDAREDDRQADDQGDGEEDAAAGEGDPDLFRDGGRTAERASRVGRDGDEHAEAEGHSQLVCGVDHPRGCPGVCAVDSRDTGARQGRERQTLAGADEVSIQSISKVFTMAQVIQEQGPDAIEKRIGVDATGARFNSIIAVEAVKTVAGTGAPEMNPLVNPGAISATSMVTGPADAVWSKIIGFHNAPRDVS